MKPYSQVQNVILVHEQSDNVFSDRWRFRLCRDLSSWWNNLHVKICDSGPGLLTCEYTIFSNVQWCTFAIFSLALGGVIIKLCVKHVVIQEDLVKANLFDYVHPNDMLKLKEQLFCSDVLYKDSNTKGKHEFGCFIRRHRHS